MTHVLEKTRNFDGETALRAIQGSGGYKTVRSTDGIQYPAGIQPIGVEQKWIDDDFHLLVAIAADVGFEHRRNPFDFLLQVAADLQQGPFRHLAAKRDDDNRE